MVSIHSFIFISILLFSIGVLGVISRRNTIDSDRFTSLSQNRDIKHG